MKIPHRTHVAPDGRMWRYTCPGCRLVSGRILRRERAGSFAFWHAMTCPELRILNRRALGCWNCDGTGRVRREVCLVCLGRGWTEEPQP